MPVDAFLAQNQLKADQIAQRSQLDAFDRQCMRQRAPAPTLPGEHAVGGLVASHHDLNRMTGNSTAFGMSFTSGIFPACAGTTR